MFKYRNSCCFFRFSIVFILDGKSKFIFLGTKKSSYCFVGHAKPNRSRFGIFKVIHSESYFIISRVYELIFTRWIRKLLITFYGAKMRVIKKFFNKYEITMKKIMKKFLFVIAKGKFYFIFIFLICGDFFRQIWLIKFGLWDYI